MSPVPPDPNEPNPAPIAEVGLGDAVGDNARLDATKPEMAEAIQKDAPGTNAPATIGLLFRVRAALFGDWTPDVSGAARRIARILKFGVKRFTNIEANRIKVRAEAYETRVTADAEAHKTRVAADADAELKRAEAEEIRARSKHREMLLRMMIERGIDLRGEIAEGTGDLRIAFTKALPPPQRRTRRGKADPPA